MPVHHWRPHVLDVVIRLQDVSQVHKLIRTAQIMKATAASSWTINSRQTWVTSSLRRHIILWRHNTAASTTATWWRRLRPVRHRYTRFSRRRLNQISLILTRDSREFVRIIIIIRIQRTQPQHVVRHKWVQSMYGGGRLILVIANYFNYFMANLRRRLQLF